MELYLPQKLIRWQFIERHSMDGHFSACGIRRNFCQIEQKFSWSIFAKSWNSSIENFLLSFRESKVKKGSGGRKTGLSTSFTFLISGSWSNEISTDVDDNDADNDDNDNDADNDDDNDDADDNNDENVLRKSFFCVGGQPKLFR